MINFDKRTLKTREPLTVVNEFEKVIYDCCHSKIPPKKKKKKKTTDNTCSVSHSQQRILLIASLQSWK